MLSSQQQRILLRKYEIPIFREGFSTHPWRWIHWQEVRCFVGSPERQAEKHNLSRQFFWTMFNVLKFWSLTLKNFHQSVKLSSTACLPSSSEQCLMFWNLRPKSQEINESLPQCPIGRERMWQFHQSVKIYSNTFVELVLLSPSSRKLVEGK